MNAKTPGTCQNGGCLRLATVMVRIPMLGDRHLCWMCQQALDPLGFTTTYRKEPRSGQKVSPFPGAA